MTETLKDGRVNTFCLLFLFIMFGFSEAASIYQGNGWGWLGVVLYSLGAAALIYQIKNFSRKIKESEEGDEWMRRFEEYSEWQSIPFDAVTKEKNEN